MSAAAAGRAGRAAVRRPTPHRLTIHAASAPLLPPLSHPSPDPPPLHPPSTPTPPPLSPPPSSPPPLPLPPHTPHPTPFITHPPRPLARPPIARRVCLRARPAALPHSLPAPCHPLPPDDPEHAGAGGAGRWRWGWGRGGNCTAHRGTGASRKRRRLVVPFPARCHVGPRTVRGRAVPHAVREDLVRNPRWGSPVRALRS